MMILEIFIFMSIIRLKNLQNGYINLHEFQKNWNLIHDCHSHITMSRVAY